MSPAEEQLPLIASEVSQADAYPNHYWADWAAAFGLLLLKSLPLHPFTGRANAPSKENPGELHTADEDCILRTGSELTLMMKDNRLGEIFSSVTPEYLEDRK